MNNQNVLGYVAMLILFSALMCFLSYYRGVEHGTADMQIKAVENDCAEFVIDKLHNKRFKWKK